MIEQPHDEQLFQRYLLGDLAEEEREHLQERYFVDARLFSRLLSAETDLIDAYGRGELTEEDRKRFEQRFGDNRGIDKRLKFASGLRRAADQHSISTPAELPAWGRRPSLASAPASGFAWLSSISPSLGSLVVRASLVAFAAVIVLMAALVVANRWLPWSPGEPGSDLARSQTESPTERPTTQTNAPVTPGTTELNEKSRSAGAPTATKPEEHRRPSLPKAQLASVSVVLHEGITRAGGQATQVVLSPVTKSLHMQLELPSELQTRTYSSYQAVLQTVSGSEVIRRDGLKISKASGGSLVRVSIPAEVLTTRDYVVLLSGQRSDGTPQYLRGYSFTVSRK
jgi:hypothetical protein